MVKKKPAIDMVNARRLLKLAANPNFPLANLAAIKELRDELDVLEKSAIDQARSLGASDEQISVGLGVTRQAISRRYPINGAS